MIFVPLHLIDPNPFQPRLTMSDDGIRELADDIRIKADLYPATLGLMSVPHVRSTGAGRYELVFGHRRHAAFALLAVDDPRYAQLPVDVDDLDDVSMAVSAWAENTKRQDLSPIDQAAFIATLRREYGWSLKRIAASLGIPHGTVGNLVRLLSLPPSLQDQMRRGEVPTAVGVELLRLRPDVADRDRLMAEAPTLTPAMARSRVNAAIKAHRNTTRTEHATAIYEQVVIPATDALATSLDQDDLRAWILVLRALDLAEKRPLSRREVCEDISRALVERMTSEATTRTDARRAVNRLFGSVDLASPWAAEATTKVEQFLTYAHSRNGRDRIAS